MNASGPRVAILVASFNRREATIRGLSAGLLAGRAANLGTQVYLVDDGSTDGTADAVRRELPEVQVIVGGGNLFWNRGMHKAFAAAAPSDPDYYLWLNDDTVIAQDAIARLRQSADDIEARTGQAAIVVGTVSDPVTGCMTYGGHRRVSRLNPIKYAPVQPGTSPVRCDTMNGNLVLVTRRAARLVGNLDPVFEHAMGDTDYALRAALKGCGVWVAPGFHGVCARNSPAGTYADASLGLRTRFRKILERKGLPWRSWLHFTRRHAGPFWPVFFVWPYLSLPFRHWRAAMAARRSDATSP